MLRILSRISATAGGTVPSSVRGLAFTVALVGIAPFATRARAADVTIDSAVAAPQLGQGGTFTVTPTGTISGDGDGIVAQTGNEITTLTVDGVIASGTAASGVRNFAGSTMSAINASGTIQGGWAIQNDGSIGSISNTGLIAGTREWAILGATNSSVGEFTNAGTIESVKSGVGLWTTGTVANLAGGLIEATGFAGLSFEGVGASVGSLDNAGRILGRVVGLAAYDVSGFTSLTNSGTISGAGWAGIDIYATGTTATLSNSGVITAGGGDGIAAGSGTIVTLVNSGTVSGSRHGIFNDTQNTIGTLTNEASGLINGNSAGLYVSSTTTAPMDVTNAGRITGSNAGVHIVNSRLLKLTNTGTLSFSGTGTGPAVRVGPGSVLGVASGTAGEALASTGAGALLDGTIVNQGTVHYGFAVENQNVTVSAGGGTGTFTNGTLDVADGDLLFTSGVLALDADVAVHGGAGLFTNEATVVLGDAQTVTGNFSQSSAGTFRSIISGSNAYGSLLIDGVGTFAGGLDLDLSGFTLAEGQTFDLFSFDGSTGGFSGLSVDGVALASAGNKQWTYGDLTLREVWTPTSMSISAVPEPSTWALALAGIGVTGYSTWRRRTGRRSARASVSERNRPPLGRVEDPSYGS